MFLRRIFLPSDGCDHVDEAAGTWVIGKPCGQKEGGVVFALTESHFEKDAAFQERLI